MKKFLQSNGLTLSIVLTLVACAVALLLRLFTEKDLPFQIFAAIIGVIITAIITQVLLKGQSDSEEVKEKNMTVFVKKQEVYHDFLEKLHAIVQDGQITINQKGVDGKIDKSVDELKDLIFQLGLLQLHTSKETIESVMTELATMIQTLNDFNSADEISKQQELPRFYSSFSHSLFIIVSILKQDLYDKENCEPIEEDTMQRLLKECKLYVETNSLNPKALQIFFWDSLQDKLLEKGYAINKKDFRADVEQYYARARNRHRWFGFDFPVKLGNGKEVRFKVRIDNGYYYGFYRMKQDEEFENQVIAFISGLGLAESERWLGSKYPSEELYLDFWRKNSRGFIDLNDPRKRDAFVGRIADDMDFYIKEVQKKFNQ